jgi:hypothetical protein
LWRSMDTPTGRASAAALHTTSLRSAAMLLKPEGSGAERCVLVAVTVVLANTTVTG